MSLCKLAEAMFSKRKHFEPMWDVTYRYIAPERASVWSTGQHETPGTLQENVFDSTAIEAAEKLVNLLISGLIPPWGKWFRINPRETLDDQTREELRPALGQLEQTMLQVINGSNFYQEAQPAILDEVVGGTGAVGIHEHNGKLRFRCIPLSELAIHEDVLGRVTHAVRRTDIDVGSLKRLYWDKIPEQRRYEFENKKDHEFCAMYEMSILGADEQYTYVKVLKGEPEVELERSVTRHSRIVAFRWSKIPGYSYGRGPGMRAISDVRAMNKLKELTLKNAALAVSGVYTVVNDGVLNPHTLTIQPGALIPVATNSPNDPSVMPLPAFAQFDVANFSMDSLSNSIKAAFMADQFQPLGRTPLSATEVAERTRVIASDMGASLSRLQNEFLVPVLQYVLDWLKRTQGVPDVADLGGEFTELQFVSRLAQAQWAEEQGNLAELLQIAQGVGQFDPRAGLVVDGEAAVREFAHLNGTPDRLLRTTEQVTEMVDAQQQQMPGVPATGPEMAE